MKKALLLCATLLFALSAVAAAETWTNAALIDINCANKKADPDRHTVQCALHCAGDGLGILASDGSFLKFDAAGTKKAVAALKATKKVDHIRATVTGDREGEIIKVQSLKLD